MSSKERLQRAANSAIQYPFGLRTAIMELFDIGPWVAFTALAIAAAILVAALVYFVRSAPPSTITISAGPEGSMFYKSAVKYAKVIERNGVKAKVLPSKGSVENLARLVDPKSGVDLGIVQSGPADPAFEQLVSLGSVSYQPLLVFYRGQSMELLSALKGKRIVIGPEGSGTRKVALAILALNGMKEGAGNATFIDGDAEFAANGLKDKSVDAAFVMSESATTDILKGLMRNGDIHLFDFHRHANALSRKLDYLNVLELPEGVIDPGNDLPSKDVTLLGPNVELIAPKRLHPALVDLVVEAATETHSRPGIFQKRGEFPAPIEHSIRMSEDATTYYKSGKSYLYRTLPFWLASFLTRVLLVFVPVLVVLIPALRSIPAFFRWVARLRIRKRYRELRLLEQRFLFETDPAKKEILRHEFDRIDDVVNRMRVRASFADQFYGLRGHIDYVRRIVERPRSG